MKTAIFHAESCLNTKLDSTEFPWIYHNFPGSPTCQARPLSHQSASSASCLSSTAPTLGTMASTDRRHTSSASRSLSRARRDTISRSRRPRRSSTSCQEMCEGLRRHSLWASLGCSPSSVIKLSKPTRATVGLRHVFAEHSIAPMVWGYSRDAAGGRETEEGLCSRQERELRPDRGSESYCEYLASTF